MRAHSAGAFAGPAGACGVLRGSCGSLWVSCGSLRGSLRTDRTKQLRLRPAGARARSPAGGRPCVVLGDSLRFSDDCRLWVETSAWEGRSFASVCGSDARVHAAVPVLPARAARLSPWTGLNAPAEGVRRRRRGSLGTHGPSSDAAEPAPGVPPCVALRARRE